MNWKFLVNDIKATLTPKGMLNFVKSHKYTLAISIAFSLVGLFLFVTVDLANYHGAIFKLVRDYELKTIDARFTFRGKRKADPRIKIVVIDQTTVNQYRWPFPRFLHAKMLDRVCGDGARAVGLDIFFPYKDPTTP